MVEFPEISFIVISDVFDRYTIVMNSSTRETSVYCEECDVWVKRYEGDQLSRKKPPKFLEMVVDDHEHQVLGKPVEISEPKGLHNSGLIQ